MKQKTQKHLDECRNIVVVSDLHAGCRLGLCPRSGIDLDDGGHYTPRRAQLALCDIWDQLLDEFVPAETKGEPVDLVVNGDVIDGVHHNSTTQISANIEDQQRIACALINDIKKRLPVRHYYHVRGTEAHVGKSAVYEEQVAKACGAVPNSEGQYARYDLWLKRRDRLMHFLHHIGTTSSRAYELSGVGKELYEEFVEAAKIGAPLPDCVVRSHRHSHSEARLPAAGRDRIIFVTAAWQLKTPFAWRVSGARLSQPQIGGHVIRISDEGVLYTRHHVKSLERTPAE